MIRRCFDLPQRGHWPARHIALAGRFSKVVDCGLEIEKREREGLGNKYAIF